MVNKEALGLRLYENFISPEEETEILSHLKGTVQSRSLQRNSIQRFGSTVPYRGNLVSASIPEYLETLCQRLTENGLLSTKPDSVTINEYKKGQGITPHIDSDTSGPVITVLSLLSPATMKFELKKENFKVLLAPCSVVQMVDEIRTKWMHSILPVENDRWSIVFRCSESKK